MISHFVESRGARKNTIQLSRKHQYFDQIVDAEKVVFS
jgi:hypothetical protein